MASPKNYKETYRHNSICCLYVIKNLLRYTKTKHLFLTTKVLQSFWSDETVNITGLILRKQDTGCLFILLSYQVCKCFKNNLLFTLVFIDIIIVFYRLIDIFRVPVDKHNFSSHNKHKTSTRSCGARM